LESHQEQAPVIPDLILDLPLPAEIVDRRHAKPIKPGMTLGYTSQ